MSPAELIEQFSFFDSWEDRYAYVIELGKQLPAMPDELRTESSRVQGCISQVWVVSRPGPDGLVEFIGDSDAHIVRGLVAILLSLYSGKTPAEIRSLDALDVLAKIGLDEHLSLNRRNGLRAMVERMRALAQAYHVDSTPPAPEGAHK
jgi:cysteine desulfuration protein SufE